MVDEEEALPGRSVLAFELPDQHIVLDAELLAIPKDEEQVVYLGLGCFWGAERLFWRLPGVVTTAVGYMGGFTPNPTYEEVCTGLTAHAEIVRVVFKPEVIGLKQLLTTFWQEHDPTQGLRQGNDVGSQYRSVVFVTTPEQLVMAEESKSSYQQALTKNERGQITTEIELIKTTNTFKFYPAEAYHQQYLEKVPNGYCGLQGTGVVCPS